MKSDVILRNIARFLAIFLPIVCNCQSAKLKLYLTGEAFTKDSIQTNIKKISRNGYALSNYLVVRYTDGTNKKVLKKDIWGYKDSDGTVYRQFDGEFYPITYNAEVMIYKQSGRFTKLYFSENTNSPIYPLTKKQLKNHLASGTYNKAQNDPKLRDYF